MRVVPAPFRPQIGGYPAGAAHEIRDAADRLRALVYVQPSAPGREDRDGLRMARQMAEALTVLTAAEEAETALAALIASEDYAEVSKDLRRQLGPAYNRLRAAIEKSYTPAGAGPDEGQP